MSFPSPPWNLRGHLLLSLWRVDGRVVATAFVDYRPPGALAYRELLSARPVLVGRTPAVRLTEIWVDSVASRDGGRALWAIPKELADLRIDPCVDGGIDGGIGGGIGGCAASASADQRPIATARFSRGRRLPGRWPVRLRTCQHRDGRTVQAPLRARARVHLARAEWTVAADGPLGYLAGRRPWLSLSLTDVALRIG